MVGINTSYTSRATSTASISRSQSRATGSTNGTNQTNKFQTTKKPQIDSFSPSKGTSSTPTKNTQTSTKSNNIFTGSAPRTSSKPTLSNSSNISSSAPRTGSFGSLTTSTRTASNNTRVSSSSARPTASTTSTRTASNNTRVSSSSTRPTASTTSTRTASNNTRVSSSSARPTASTTSTRTTTQTTTKNQTTINYNDLAKNFTTQADKEKFTDIIKNLPQEVQEDIAKEINNMRPANADEYGTFNPVNNNLAVTLDDHAKFIIAHEVGHSVDTISTNVNGVTVNQSSLSKLISEDKDFAATYEQELKDFLAAYKDEFGTDHPWVKSYPTEHYPTEAFATYYRHETLGYEKTTASGKDWADLMISKMPETTKAIANLIDQNRQLSDDERQAQTEKYYDNGQIKSSVTSNNGIVYADGYNEDGSKAYQIQIYPDGTEQYIIDNYDANGNKLEPTYYTVKPQDKEQHGGGGRRR